MSYYSIVLIPPSLVAASYWFRSFFFFFFVLLLKEGVKTWTIWPMVFFFFSAYLMSYVYSISLIIFVFFFADAKCFVFSRYSLKISSQSLKSNHLKPYNHYLFPQAFSLSIKNKLQSRHVIKRLYLYNSPSKFFGKLQMLELLFY